MCVCVCGQDWKIVDERRLAVRLRHALQQLELTEASCKTALEINEVRAQQQRLKSKLSQIAGPAEVQAYEKESRSRAMTTGRCRGATAARVERQSSVVQEPPAAEGPRVVGSMTNEQLAHELLLNPQFSLSDDAMSEDKMVHVKITRSFERAFWLSLADDLILPSYTRVLSVLKEISDGIQTLARGHYEETEIREIVDIDLIKQRISQDAFDFGDSVNLLDSIIRVICKVHNRMKAERSSAETMQKWVAIMAKLQSSSEDKKQAFCEALELCIERVHVVRTDCANNKLRAIAPVIQHHGVEYERSHFKKKLELGQITLDNTKSWILHTIGKESVESMEALRAGSAQAFESVVHTGVVDLLVEYPNWGGVTRSGDKVPETLLLDLLRIKGFNAHFHILVKRASIIVTVDRFIKSLEAGRRDAIMQEVLKALEVTPPKRYESSEAVEAVVEALPLDDHDLATLKGFMENHVKEDHAVYKELVRLFRRFWLATLKGEEPSEESLRLPASAKKVCEDLHKYASDMKSMVALNLKVHVSRYNQVIMECLAE